MPNITGKFGYEGLSRDMTGSGETNEGALYNAGKAHGAYGGTSYSGSVLIGFDASRDNEIYGASDEVQPRTLLYPYYIVIANNINKADVNFNNIATDLNQLNSSLNVKLNFKDTKETAVLVYEGTAVTGTAVTMNYDIVNGSATFLYIQCQSSDGYHFGATIPTSVIRQKYATSTTKIVVSTDSIYASIYFPSNNSFYIVDKSGATNIISMYAIYNTNIGPSFGSNNATYLPAVPDLSDPDDNINFV